ncbi:MAG: P-II family nitrogen regulator [Desulfomonile sp.]|jgi:nitrogen regulatory protein PII|nr:P-II family nitrogen regulator [Deltaproteobacteria bacterium]
MVLIEAFIKHFKLDDVKEALEEIGVGGMTVTEVLQASPTRMRARSLNASETRPDLVPKTKIEIVVPADLVERTVEAICLHGSTGKTEDGVVVLRRIEGAVRIRTGETDSAAIML